METIIDKVHELFERINKEGCIESLNPRNSITNDQYGHIRITTRWGSIPKEYESNVSINPQMDEQSKSHLIKKHISVIKEHSMELSKHS